MAVQSAQVTAKARTELGSRANKRLRDAGFVPGVIYGHKEAVIPVTLAKKELTGHLGRGITFSTWLDDGKSQKVLVKEVQFDHLGLEVIHVDFARVSLDEKVTLTIPLELKGTPKGEEEGGVLQQVVMELEIECLVTDIPEAIRHNVTEMGMDSVLYIKDLKLPTGVKALQDEDLIVASVREIAEEEAAAPAEGESAEPELIGRKPTEEEAAAAATEGAEKEKK